MRRLLAVLVAALGIIAVGAPATASPYSDVIIADDPVAYWRLGQSATGQPAVNSATGTSSAGAAADGAYTAGVGVGTAGLIHGDADTAVTTSAAERMATAGFEKFAGGTGFSVEFWTKFNTVPGGYVNPVGDGESGGDFDLMVYAGSGGFIRPHVRTNTGISSIDSAQTFGVGEVHHVVSTWNSTTGWLKLFIDGKQAAIVSTAGANPNTGTAINTSNAIFVGYDGRGVPSPDAVLDEAAVYNRPLSGHEIFAHHQFGRYGGLIAQPVSYWSFDESASGTGTAYDQIDGNDGTFNTPPGTATRTTGLIGTGAAQFNNTASDGVNVTNGVGHTNNFSCAAGITVEALFTTTWDGSGFDEIFRKEDGGNRILLGFQNAAAISGYNFPGISFGINDGTGYKELDMPFDGAFGRPTLAQIADGNMHHLVATYDSSSGLKAIWIDGVLHFSTIVGAGVPMISGGGTAAFIGNTAALNEPFTGVIDEVAFYNFALLPYDIAWHYGNVQDGHRYFFIPEPGTLTLLGAGLALLARRRRRRTGRKRRCINSTRNGFALVGAVVLSIIVVGSQALAAPYSTEVMADSPVSYWPFDESASGTGTAFDQIDGNDGAFAGTATRTTGLIGTTGAALFSSTIGEGVNVTNGVGHTNDFSFTTGMTVEALILPGANLGNRTYEEIFRKEDGGNRILFSFQNNGSFLSFGINAGGYAELGMPLDGVDGRPTLADLKDGQPHHIAATYEAATGLKALYVDGTKRFSTKLALGTNMASGGVTDAVIGNFAPGSEPFDGVIDEVAVYDHALTPVRIATHYNAAGGRVVLPTSVVLSTDVMGPGLFGDSHTNGATVELVRFIPNSDASPHNIDYNQASDTIDFAPYVVAGNTGGILGSDQHGRDGANLWIPADGEADVPHVGFGAHANWLVTFDIQEILARHLDPAPWPLLFTGRVGVNGNAAGQVPPNAVIQGGVWVDGELLEISALLSGADPSYAFDLRIPRTANYLTLALLNGNPSSGWDDIAFRDVTLSLDIPEPATLTLLGAGLAVLARRRRRRRK
jgi:hypothetical protein